MERTPPSDFFLWLALFFSGVSHVYVVLALEISTSDWPIAKAELFLGFCLPRTCQALARSVTLDIADLWETGLNTIFSPDD